jgi:hypothetical protein
MDLHPQPLSGRHIESVPVGSAEVRLLGSVASARGVQVIAFDDVANYRGDFTSTLMSLSYLSRIPANRMLSVDRRPARPVRPLNFVVPGVPVATHGGPVRGVFCIFSPGFFKDLSETDVSLRFDAIDFLIDIESERLTYLGRTMLREAIQPGFASSVFTEAMGMAIALEITRYDSASRSDEGGAADSRCGRCVAWNPMFAIICRAS